MRENPSTYQGVNIMRSKSEIVFLSILAVVLMVLLLAAGITCAMGASRIENRTDEIMCAIISIGGVVGVVVYSITSAVKERLAK
jgi:uncharacterized membrane protein